METHLTIKHLAPYLPYKLRVSSLHTLNAEAGIANINHIVKVVNEGKKQYRPVLRPLLDLNKEIEVNGEKFVPIEWLLENREVDAEFDFISALEDDWACAEDKIIFAPLSIAQKLYEWHFDIHGLIEKGLAIDKNTL